MHVFLSNHPHSSEQWLQAVFALSFQW
jgi:N-acetylglucosaminylphosphatidylinositol deacetylase